VSSLDLLSKYLLVMELRFEAMLYTLTLAMKIRMRATPSVHEESIWPAGCRLPTPDIVYSSGSQSGRYRPLGAVKISRGAVEQKWAVRRR